MNIKFDNKKAIAVYLDDYDKIDEELSWLYKTWVLYSLDDEFDLVVYHHPDAKKRLEKYDGITPVPMPYTRLSNQYKFLNSHYFCTDGWNYYLKKYKYVLKTDCDVFLTQNIKNYTPSSFLIGEGGYYLQSNKIYPNDISQISKILGLEYNSMPSIGTSFFGETRIVIELVSLQASITEFLLKNYNQNILSFDRGVASMIAGEVAVNHIFNNQFVKLYCLDEKCWETTKIGTNVIHIHAWHSAQKWSKHDFFDGKYSDWKIEADDAFANAANYCHWIATSTYDEIFYMRKQISNGLFRPNYKLI